MTRDKEKSRWPTKPTFNKKNKYFLRRGRVNYLGAVVQQRLLLILRERLVMIHTHDRVTRRDEQEEERDDAHHSSKEVVLGGLVREERALCHQDHNEVPYGGGEKPQCGDDGLHASRGLCVVEMEM
jgi:hypothetical protein